MKKLSKAISLSLSVLLLSMFFAGGPTYAREVDPSTTNNPETKYDEMLLKLEQKADERYDMAYTKWVAEREKDAVRRAKFLEVVTEFAPDMVDDYELAFDTHYDVHEELFSTHTDIRLAYFEETKVLLAELKTELLTKVSAGEITWREAQAIIKDFLIERKTNSEANWEAYRSSIEPAKLAWQAKVEEVKALHAELRLAIKDGDSELAAETINEIYSYLLEHITFDEFKLTTLKAHFGITE